MKKYYFEIWHKEQEFEAPYILQSKWFDTREQALEWVRGIDYLDLNFDIDLMSSEVDENGDYGDIELDTPMASIDFDKDSWEIK